MNKDMTTLRSILIIDDNEDSLEIYSKWLKKNTKASILCTKMPSEGIHLANKYFFDMILIDVTMNYHDTPFGGLEVYNTLRGRYGDCSLIVYSQVITDDLPRRYGEPFNFIEKGENLEKFMNELIKRMVFLRKRQSCFVAMPFHRKYNQVYNVIKKSVGDSCYRCVRVDNEQFNKSIIEKIFSEIKQAKLIIFLANDQNPNAFYECGYSVALNKEVITITDVYENLPFDIRDRNSLSYGDDLKKLSIALNKKLQKITHMPV